MLHQNVGLTPCPGPVRFRFDRGRLHGRFGADVLSGKVSGTIYDNESSIGMRARHGLR